GVVLDRVVTRTPLLHDASAFGRERRRSRKPLAACAVWYPDAGDRRAFRRGRVGAGECGRDCRPPSRPGRHVAADHRPNSVPSGSRSDHMYISCLPVALGLPVQVTVSPTTSRSKSQPRRSSRFTLLNSMCQTVVEPSSFATRRSITECGLRTSTLSIVPVSATSVTSVATAPGEWRAETSAATSAEASAASTTDRCMKEPDLRLSLSV